METNQKSQDEIMDEMERSYFETDKFEAIGKGNDYNFQILSFLGTATHNLIVANTISKSVGELIPKELEDELSSIISRCSELKEKIRNHEESQNG